MGTLRVMRVLVAILCAMVSAPVFGMAEAWTQSGLEVVMMAGAVAATSGSYGLALACSSQRIARYVMAPTMLGLCALTLMMPVAGVATAMLGVMVGMITAAYTNP